MQGACSLCSLGSWEMWGEGERLSLILLSRELEVIPAQWLGIKSKEATAQPLCRQCGHSSPTHLPPELGVPAYPHQRHLESQVHSVGAKAPSLDGGMMGRT